MPCCGLLRQVSYLCWWSAALVLSATIWACLSSGLSWRFCGISMVRFSWNFIALFPIEYKHVLSNSWHLDNFVLLFLLRKWARRTLVHLKLSQMDISPRPPIFLGMYRRSTSLFISIILCILRVFLTRMSASFISCSVQLIMPNE